MTHAPTPLKLRATTAICAVLALGTTPVWAQEVAPTLDAPAPTQQPTIQLPDVAPAAPPPAASAPSMVSQPMVQQTPVTPPPVAAVAEEPAPARRTIERTVPATRTAPTPQPVAATAPAERAPTSIAPAPVVVVPAPVSAVAPAPVAPIAVDAAPSRTVDIVDADSALGAGALATLLVALGLGGGAWFAMRARRRRRWGDYQGAYETQPTQVYAPIPAVTPAGVTNEPTDGLAPEAPRPAYATIDSDDDVRRAIGEEELATATVAPPVRTAQPATSAPATSAPATSAYAAGPVPQSREERDELLDRMVAEAPSAENPFTSGKARLRRARIILQSREIDQQQNATQPFDWRTYKPSTSNPTPALPPRVTA